MLLYANKMAFAGAFCALCLVCQSCATKKYLHEAIAPLQERLNSTDSQVGNIQKQVATNHEAIGDLDRSVATTSEKAEEAQRKAQEAADAAARAVTAAAEAARKAAVANLAALKVQQDLERATENIDTFRQVASEQIFFGVGRSTLDKTGEQTLDALAQKLASLKGYVVEVEGFSDSTGNAAANLRLSEERADAVVHYLVLDRSIPPASVHQLGAGSAFPGADNKNSAARKNNRRVDLRVYTRDVGVQHATGSAQ